MNRPLFLIPCATMMASLALSDAQAQNTAKQAIASPNAPEAIGPYSQAIRSGKTLYLSGQIAIDPRPSS